MNFKCKIKIIKSPKNGKQNIDKSGFIPTQNLNFKKIDISQSMFKVNGIKYRRHKKIFAPTQNFVLVFMYLIQKPLV